MLCLGAVPLLYLLFDDLSPALAKRFPALSEFFDNVIVVVLPGTTDRIDLKNGGKRLKNPQVFGGYLL
jgi:hypothetical protein